MFSFHLYHASRPSYHRRTMHIMDPFENIPLQTNSFESHDFIHDPNFDQLIDLIRGENEDAITCFDYDYISNYYVDNQFDPTPIDTLDFNDIVVADSNHGFNNGEEESSRTTTTTATTITTTSTTPNTRKMKVDRSKTLVSERRRRRGMKEMLYALRSLVPNITKMDKASIVGDAVLYIQDLQMKAKNLKAEIAALEAYQESIQNPKKSPVTTRNNPIFKKIIQMDVFQVEERGYYVRLACTKGEGVVVSLYKALESLTSFNVQNSNLATLSERLVLTSTLYVREEGLMIMNLPNLKLWVTEALINQGFEFLTPN
ncbi:HLH domain-containing protein [Cephalotus follicularis]|uniref:HLH domain-containing protein n=1 Tax=Cephalotus follicularis TaxID=3775 RepID=A0A1Q3BZQ3_CEPFO|nr:HLH domain-containing protein [Cephalotus follicularis]